MLLNISNIMYVESKEAYKRDIDIFDKGQYIQKITNMDNDLLTYYSNNYNIIHGAEETSDLIKKLSNSIGDNNTFFFFNNE